MTLRPRSSERGFTLIEMVVVISLILVLLSIALPMYNQSILRAKESTLRQDLFTLRHVIQQYTLDKQKAPQALDDLVAAHYLKFRAQRYLASRAGRLHHVAGPDPARHH